MATMASVEAVALPPAEPPASAQTNGESGSGAFDYLALGPIMHAAELRQPAEGRGGAPGDASSSSSRHASSSSSEESACRSEAAPGREGRPRRRLPAPSSTLDDFMARRRQTVAGATPCFKSEPPGKLDRRLPSPPVRASELRLRGCAPPVPPQHAPGGSGRLLAARHPRHPHKVTRPTGRHATASAPPPPRLLA